MMEHLTPIDNVATPLTGILHIPVCVNDKQIDYHNAHFKYNAYIRMFNQEQM